MRNNKRYIVMQNDKKFYFECINYEDVFIWKSIFIHNQNYKKSLYISNKLWNDKNRKWVNACLIEYSTFVKFIFTDDLR